MSAAARAEPGTRLSAALVAEQTGVPLPTVQKLMGRLAQSGLLGSARGSGGGFVLARAADSISLADIVEAVDGPIAMTACVDQGRHDCGLETGRRVRSQWHEVTDTILCALAGVSTSRHAHGMLQ